MKQRAAIYSRISSDPKRTKQDGSEAERGLGVARQEEACRALAKARKLALVDVFSDNDVSAYSGKPRPGYRRMCQGIEAGLIDVVLCWHPDRLHRSPRELEAFIDLLEKAGTTVHSVQAGPYDLGTPSGRMTARVVGAVARSESEHKSARIRAQKEQALKAGKHIRDPRTFGFDKSGVVKAEAKLLRDAAEQVLAGQAIYAVVQRWNADGVPTVGKARAWTCCSVRQVLKRWRNCGMTEANGEALAKASWPAIMPREQVEALRALFADPNRPRPVRTDFSHWLANVATCAQCGPAEKLISGTNQSYTVYRHSPYEGRMSCGMSINKDVIEPVVEQAVISYLVWRTAASSSLAAPSDNATVASLRAKLRAVDAEQASWAAQVVKGGRSAKLAVAHLDRLDAEAEQIQQQIAMAEQREDEHALLSKLAEQMLPAPGRVSLEGSAKVKAEISARWASLPAARKRELVRRLFTVTVAKGRGVDRVRVERI